MPQGKERSTYGEQMYVCWAEFAENMIDFCEKIVGGE
jgi:hypothetical protein